MRSTLSLEIKEDKLLDFAENYGGCIFDDNDVLVTAGKFLFAQRSLANDHGDLWCVVHLNI